MLFFFFLREKLLNTENDFVHQTFIWLLPVMGNYYAN